MRQCYSTDQSFTFQLAARIIAILISSEALVDCHSAGHCPRKNGMQLTLLIAGDANCFQDSSCRTIPGDEISPGEAADSPQRARSLPGSCNGPRPRVTSVVMSSAESPARSWARTRLTFVIPERRSNA